MANEDPRNCNNAKDPFLVDVFALHRIRIVAIVRIQLPPLI